MYHQDFKQAGQIAKQALQYGASLVKPGASYTEVLTQIVAKIKELGAQPAFPPQMAMNQTAAHFMPFLGDDVVFNDELIKLDVGVSYKGAIGDNATTIDLSGAYTDLVKASRQAVESTVEMMDIGVSLHEVGKHIQEVIESYEEFTPIKNLSGHGLGPFQIHTKPSIPNYGNGDTTTIKPGMTFACEPFATTGKGMIHDAGNAAIYRFLQRKPQRLPEARVLQEVFEKTSGLPFCLQQLDIPKMPLFKLKVAMRSLQQSGALESYGALVESSGGMVSQAEHSILFDDEGKKWVTTR
ncbi:MAG: type II methionyl aminopeptidase [Candidatus Woesearchaeota archaeon]